MRKQGSAIHTRSLQALLRGVSFTITLLLIAIFVFALTNQLDAFEKYNWHIEYLPVAGAALLALCRGIPIAYPWWRIVTGWGEPLSLGKALRIYFHSGLARYLPGQWWFVPTRAALAKQEGVRVAATLASTAVETVLVTGIAVSTAMIGTSTLAILPALARILLLVGGILIPLTIGLSPKLLVLLSNRILRARGYEPIEGTLSAADTAKSMASCYLNWLMYGGIAAVLLTGSAGAGLMQVPAVIGLFATSVLGGSLALVVPQGIVIREGVLVYLLNSTLGVPVHVGLAVAGLTRLIAMAAEGLWALVGTRL